MKPSSMDWRARLEACGFEGAQDVPPGYAAHVLRSWREPLAAEAALREQLEHQPEDKDALKTLIALLRELGRGDEERPLRRQLQERRCQDLRVPEHARDTVISYLEAAETGSPPPERSADAYVSALFDLYAPTFDDSLRGFLDYRAPERLLDAVLTALGSRRGLDVLDLGCGTGLAGPLLKPLARNLEGIDLSTGMLDKARERGVYDALHAGEITARLAASPARPDLIVAVDVLVYFGALEPLFAQVARRLAPEGLFAFTVEKSTEPGYRLQPSARYAHHLDYVRHCALLAGLHPVVEREDTLRRQAGQPVIGHVVVLAHAAP
ncbi:methyltransferase domain-containing protein [Cystobacter fuscus]|uniref:class I SAM-dependent DNA methyltransferase n=1 Tax=Cystobacter fuscus TaxID=43 RepID=UPI002B30BCFE|nr:methyltransferase domain-containing protein [Cystobacter fuscus]